MAKRQSQQKARPVAKSALPRPPKAAKQKRVLVIGYAPEYGQDPHAYTLYKALKADAGFEVRLIASIPSGKRDVRGGITLQQYQQGEPDAVAYINAGYEPFKMSQVFLSSLASDFQNDLRTYLRDFQPETVFIGDIAAIGQEVLALVHFTLPEARILCCLNTLTPIAWELADARLLAEKDCAPQELRARNADVSAAVFALRADLLKAHLAFADTFFVPSKEMAALYSKWGIPGVKIVVQKPCYPFYPAIQGGEGRKIGFLYQGEDAYLQELLVCLGPERVRELVVFYVSAQAQDAVRKIISATLHDKNQVESFFGVSMHPWHENAERKLQGLKGLVVTPKSPVFLVYIASDMKIPLYATQELAYFYDVAAVPCHELRDAAETKDFSAAPPHKKLEPLREVYEKCLTPYRKYI
ncbi:MAG: glycosyltransferase [Hyphomicrobiales bacterium]|nr:glycosyltransferase [Hyphomicrobiales bacterium]